MAQGTVTLMFTDLVGSTELLGRLGEDGAAEVRRRHFTALREAIAAANGTQVKNLGDGVMVVFSSARDAVACARAVQLAVQRHDGVDVRIGLHAGEPDREEGDYFGTPVVVASRLCARAAAGQILASDVVRGLAGPREGGTFRLLGPIALKGLREPVSTWEVGWGAPEDAAGRTESEIFETLHAPLPPVLTRTELAFVGRAGDVENLRSALAKARGEGLQVGVVAGEPGIGKTRLAAEFARGAHADGALVLFGRCDEEGLVPYQPFAEAVRTYLTAVPAAESRALGLERLTGAVPLAESKDSDPTVQRLALFESVASFLRSVSAAGPLVLILDDLHWADGPSLALLRHLVRRGQDIPALVVGTYRDTELARTHPLSATLAELRRDHKVERVSLVGLTKEEVGGMLAEAAGHEPPVAFVHALHSETEGNPFFIEEIVRHLVEAGTIVQRDGRWTSDQPIGDMGIPEGVREAVGRRLARLSEAANRALSDASALGRRFDFDVLSEMSGLDEDSLLDVLDEALQAQLVVDAAEGGRAAYAFRHALVRETLYEELTLPRRQRLHLRAAEALEKVLRDVEPHAGTLALHLQQAGAAVDPKRALEWTLKAAGASAEQLAWEDAANQLEAALELMEEAGARPEERAPLLERLADLRYVTSLDLEDGIARLEEALACYEGAGLADRAARVHTRLARDRATYWGPTMNLARAREHLEAARDLIPVEPETAALANLELSAATVWVWSINRDEAMRASAKALDIAQRLNRPLLMLNAEIMDAFALLGTGDPEGYQRLELAWREADLRNHPWLAFLASWMGCSVGFWFHGIAEHQRWLVRELASARNASALGQRRILQNFHAWTDAQAGRVDRAMATLEQNPLPEFPAAEAMVALVREGPTAGREHGEEILRDGERSANPWTRMLAMWWIVDGLFGEGDVAGAAAVCEEQLEMLDRGGVSGFAEVRRCHLIVLQVLAGNLDRARELWEQSLGSGIPDEVAPTIEARRLIAAGAMAAAEGNREEADAGFARGIALLEPLEDVWAAAIYGLMWGELTHATEPVERAIAALEQMGAAQIWVDRARSARDRSDGGH